MTNNQKRELAQMLYTKGIVTNQKELADRVAISEVTISKWKKKYHWDSLRKSLLITKQEELANLYDQLSELNKWIKDKPKGERYPDTKQADIQRKLTASIKELEKEINIATVTDVFMKFSEWIQQGDFELAKKVIELQDGFIKYLAQKA